MSTGPAAPPFSGSNTPMDILRRADESSHTHYSLTSLEGVACALGMELPGIAVIPGSMERMVKVLILPKAEGETLRSRIHDNLSTLFGLKNGNVGAAEATVTIGDQWGVVFPALEGRNLDDLLVDGPMPARAASELVLELAWGLSATHSAVRPDQIRPVSIPHGSIAAEFVHISGTGEVVFMDYNVHAARSPGASAADDIYQLGALLFQAIDGMPLPPPDGDADSIRKNLESDIGQLKGTSEDLQQLLLEMLDPTPSHRPEIRSIARRLRRMIPTLEGLWLSAWAENTIGLPERQRPNVPMPTAAVVREDADSDEGAPRSTGDAKRKNHKNVDDVPPLVRQHRRQGEAKLLRFSPKVLVSVALGVIAVVGASGLVFQERITRWWLDIHGEMDMADVPTDQAGSDKAAAAGPASGGGRKGDSKAPSSAGEGGAVTIIEAEAGITAPDDGKPRPDREQVAEDKAIDTQKDASSPFDNGTGELSSPPASPFAGGPPPWPRPEGTLGDFDLFVEVPLAESVKLTCKNGLTMTGPSPFRAAIMKSPATQCSVTANLRGGRSATAAVDLKSPLDLICRNGFKDELRCSPRPTSAGGEAGVEELQEVTSTLSTLRVRIPLARTVSVSCSGGRQNSGTDIEWLELTDIPAGGCSVSALLPDGKYEGDFLLVKNAEMVCLRDFASPANPQNGNRLLRCAPASTR